MSFRKTMSLIVIAALSAVSASALAEDAAPATRPSAVAPAAEEKVSVTPEAQKQLDEVRDAYRGLKSLDLIGEMNGNIDVAGKKQTPHIEFTAQYMAPNLFRNEAKEGMLAGSNGKQIYMSVQGQYSATDLPKDKLDLTNPQGQLQENLQEMNPSLALAVTKDAEALLLDGAVSVKAADDVTIDGTRYPAISIADDDIDKLLVLDGKTHLLRRVVLDLARQAKSSGAADVNEAKLTFDYSRSTPDSSDIKAEQFDWAPAKDATEAKEEQPPAMALVGKAAPDVKLTGLDGAAHSISDLKGNVVVLDFWATWCGPCKASLPHLNELNTREAPSGLKLFAVNEAEDKDTVEKFMTANKYSFPVLLDPGETPAGGAAYMVSGIPQTVVIGKDGIVKQVFVGFGPGSAKRLQRAVASAMSETVAK